MTKEQWDEFAPEGTREYSTRKMSNNNYHNLKLATALHETSMAVMLNVALQIGLEQVLSEAAAKK